MIDDYPCSEMLFEEFLVAPSRRFVNGVLKPDGGAAWVGHPRRGPSVISLGLGPGGLGLGDRRQDHRGGARAADVARILIFFIVNPFEF